LASQADRKGGEVWGRLQKDVSSAVRQLVLSLTEAGDPDSIQGLRVWVKQAFPGQLWVSSTHAETETKAAGGESAPPTAANAASNFGWLGVLQLEASGRHEAASDACVRLLNPQLLDGLTAENGRLLAERACGSYAAVADWQGLQGWLAKVQGLRTANMGAAWTAGLSTAGLDLNPVLALGKFDEGDFSGAWSHLDRTPEGNRKVTLNPRLALQRGEQMLLQAMLEAPGAKAEEDLAAARELLDDPLSAVVTVGSLESRGPYLVQAECQRIVESVLKLVPGGKEPVGALPRALAAILKESCESGGHFDAFRPEWLKLLRAARFALRLGANAPLESGSSSSLHVSDTATLEAFRLQLVRLARRHGNVRLAQRILEQTPLHKQTSAPSQAAASELEEALVLHDLGRVSGAATLLCRTASLSDTENKLDAAVSEGRSEQIATARACLKLAEWAQAPRTSAEVMAREEGQPVSCDEVEARALLRAVEVAPQFGKARYRQAVWSDRQAPGEVQLTGEEQKVVSGLIAGLGNSGADSSRAGGLGGTLAEKVISAMEERLTPGVNDRPRSAEQGVKTPILLHGRSSLALEESVLRKVEGLCSSEGVACSEQQLAEIGRVWRGARARAVGSVAEAIKGYSLFLSLSLSSPGSSQPVSSAPRGVGRSADQSVEACREDRVLHALVQLLQLLSEHGAVLQKTFSDALRAVPVHAWQAILPQLFALMKAHPQEEVRGLVLETLEVLVRALPWAVLYPVLAGCREEEVPLEFWSLKITLVGPLCKTSALLSFTCSVRGCSRTSEGPIWLRLLLFADSHRKGCLLKTVDIGNLDLVELRSRGALWKQSNARVCASEKPI
jgi:PI-3-kinase-related kinase SMG-1